jgi:hypothetical protein
MKKQNLILPLLLFSTNNTFTNRPLWQLTSVMITGAIPAAIGATVHHMRSYNVYKEDNEHIYDTYGAPNVSDHFMTNLRYNFA